MKFSKILVLVMTIASFSFAQINLNTASKKELMMLPGIGTGKAEAIIEYRKDNKFEKIEDIKKVKGIGNKRFEMIKDDLSVTGESDTSNLKSAIKKEKAKAEKKAKKVTKEKSEKAKKEVYEIEDDTTKKIKSETKKAKKSKDEVKNKTKQKEKKTKDKTEKMTKEAKDKK